jgi:uncharacterized protein YndB with AHSA1/START domain
MADDFSGKDRRQHPRAEEAFAVYYNLKLALPVNMIMGQQEYPAIAVDISEGGIGLDMDRPLPAQTLVMLRFELINNYATHEEHRCLRFKLEAEVRHSEPTERKRFRVGVQFLKITPQERQFIAVFIRDLSQHAAAGPERPKKDSIAERADRQVVSTRVFSAKRERVWKAWSEPEHLIQWWGPNGFTNTMNDFSFRPGGIWDFMMHGPNGAEYPNRCKFEEIARPELIVFRHLKPVHEFLATVTLEDLGDKTRIVFTMLFESAAELGPFKQLILEANEQNFDRLEAQLAKIK